MKISEAIKSGVSIRGLKVDGFSSCATIDNEADAGTVDLCKRDSWMVFHASVRGTVAVTDKEIIDIIGSDTIGVSVPLHCEILKGDA